MASASQGRLWATAWRLWAHRQSTRIYRPGACATAFSWIGGERIAVGNMPTGESLKVLAEQGITHVVNCRARPQTWISQDLYAERATFGETRVIHAAMWDFGRPQPPVRWTAAALFAAAAPATLILTHRHEAVLVPNYRVSVEQWLSGSRR